MNWMDLLRMSINNLKRRKLRTFLTVLGVMIGTTSIVVMISLGLGLQQAMLQEIEDAGGMNTINVTGIASGESMFYSGDSSDEASEKRLNDSAVAELAKLDHVTSVSPLYEHIREMESNDLSSLLQDYCSSWSDRHLNALSNEIGLVLEKQKLVTRAKLGIFNGRTYFMPHQSAIPGLNAELQVDILYQNPVSSDTAFLWLLLEQGQCIPSDISGDMRDTFASKIKEALTEGADSALISAKALLDLTFSLMKKGHLIMD